MSASQASGTCGCCAGLALATPVAIENRPGLSAIAYRVGAHPHFKASLLARLAGSNHLALQRLTTRRDDDFAIALCDAWATVADVVTFYQERIANEAYLGTATERRSVAELARLIDYGLRPGVAAATHLAVTMETATGAPAETTIPAGMKVMSVPAQGEKPQTFETVANLVARGAWNQFRARRTMPGALSADATSATLAGGSLGLRVGDRVLFVGAGRRASATSSDWLVRKLARVDPDPNNNRTVIAWSGALAGLGAPVEIVALDQRSALMGASAPDPRNLAESTRALFSAQLTGSAPLEWLFALEGDHVYLDGVHAGTFAGDYALLSNAAGDVRLYNVDEAVVLSRSAYSLSARTTRLTLSPSSDLALLFHGTNLRGTTVYFGRQVLSLAEAPATTPVEGDSIVLDDTVGGLPAGRLLLVEGVDAATGQSTGEPATLLRTDPVTDGAGEYSRLVFTKALIHGYRPESLVIHGNVAPATHGETVAETVGSGDGSVSFQQMRLRQAPVTRVPAKSPTGAASTLELRVNGLQWHEVGTLFSAGPDERVFITRQEEDGATVVQFGDGANGARLPTGRENVSAVYRKGIGPDGLLAAGQLSQLITRPLGAKSVTNPLPTAGAEAPESVAASRTNCTLTIHTLDRVVSLKDYEDFARAFGGIAKSLATWFWDGRRRGVLVTVAGPNAALIAPASDLRTNLIAELRRRGDPQVPVDVRSYRPTRFGVRVTVAAAPDLARADVRGRARERLLIHFGFEARRFGHSVTSDDVLAVAQATEGVVAANLTRLNRDGQSGIASRIPAAPPSTSGGVPVGAELLTLDAGALELADLV